MTTDKRFLSLERSFVKRICQCIGSPRALSVWLCYQYNQEALLSLECHQKDYRDASSFRDDYLITELLKKFKGLEVGIDTRTEAIRKWKIAELQCLETNLRFRNTSCDGPNRRVDHLLLKMQRKIADILGPLDISKCLARCQWGPGATYDLKRGSDLAQKQTWPLSCTGGAYPYMTNVLQDDPHWFFAISGIIPEGPYCITRDALKIVRGNRFLTVPKSAKTDRCIAAEPTANSFLQQGVGRFIRERLALRGVRLDDQSINQRMAARAVFEGLATLDLSAASDTISKLVVFDLLPIDWAFFLDDLRSKETRLDGVWVPLEKFSSMGNSFTFELETLIFWAAVTAIVPDKDSHLCSVYGDDIIIPQSYVVDLVDLLSCLGFTVNEEKSFFDGVFFESCGKHYFLGDDVTPLYLKERLDSLQQLVRTHNAIYRYGDRNSERHKRYRSCLDFLLNSHKMFSTRLPAIPFGTLGDDGFILPRDRFTFCRNQGFHHLVYIYKSASYRSNDAHYLAAKYRNPKRENGSCRGYVSTSYGRGRWLFRKKWTPFRDVNASVEDTPLVN
jgi:hypothetical protein